MMLRVMTAGSVGANIGAGLALVFGVPIILWLAGVADQQRRRLSTI